MKAAYSVLVLAALSLTGAARADAPAAPIVTVVRAARLLEVASGELKADQAVLVRGERIAEVGPAAEIKAHAPAGATLIDLGDVTLLPGLIDVHTHVAMGDLSRHHDKDRLRLDSIDEAVRAHVYARRTLEAGVTSVRDLGTADYVDVALAAAIDEGVVVGPRMQPASLGVGATGGHFDPTSGLSAHLAIVNEPSGIADGVDKIRELIRTEVKHGAQVIKMAATAGVLSEEEAVGSPQYSQEEMNVIVEEAHRWGRKVAAHAHGAEGIRMATRAGVASIEHGTFIDEEGLKLMKERGTYLVPQIFSPEVLHQFEQAGMPDVVLKKARAAFAAQLDGFRRALKSGVKIAFGTDAGVYPHGENPRQLARMVGAGMAPLEALKSATLNAADLLGWSDRVGAIKPGLYADLIAVPGNPLTDMSVVERVRFVMKGGTVVKRLDP